LLMAAKRTKAQTKGHVRDRDGAGKVLLAAAESRRERGLCQQRSAASEQGIRGRRATGNVVVLNWIGEATSIDA